MKKVMLSIFLLNAAIIPAQAISPDHNYYENLIKKIETAEFYMKVAGGACGIYSGLGIIREFKHPYLHTLRTEPSFLIPTLIVPLAMVVTGIGFWVSAFRTKKCYTINH